MGLTLDPIKVLQGKVNLLFEELVPKTKQVAFNLKWNQTLARQLDMALEQGRTAQLQLADSKQSLLIPQGGILPTSGALPGG